MRRQITNATPLFPVTIYSTTLFSTKHTSIKENVIRTNEMPAPTPGDGAGRGFEEVAIPSTAVVLGVALAYHFYGILVAGLLLFGITVLGMLAIAAKAKYWNVGYTIGFLFAALFALIVIPSVLGELVHPAFDFLGDVIVLLGILFVGFLLISKLDLNSDW